MANPKHPRATPAPDTGDTLAERELAGLLSVTRQTLCAWRKSGQGPPFLERPGQRAVFHYRIADVEKWLRDIGN